MNKTTNTMSKCVVETQNFGVLGLSFAFVGARVMGLGSAV